jgi:hypothetical protein
MNTAKQRRWGLDRSLLPSCDEFFSAKGIAPIGRGEWRSVPCPVHNDRHPSARVHWATGRWVCMSCGARGDLLDFQIFLTGECFRTAAAALGAWVVK